MMQKIRSSGRTKKMKNKTEQREIRPQSAPCYGGWLGYLSAADIKRLSGLRLNLEC
jgi:hypothetical protein